MEVIVGVDSVVVVPPVIDKGVPVDPDIVQDVSVRDPALCVTLFVPPPPIVMLDADAVPPVTARDAVVMPEKVMPKSVAEPPVTLTPVPAPEREVEPELILNVPPATRIPVVEVPERVFVPLRLIVPVEPAPFSMRVVIFPDVVSPETLTVPDPETKARPRVAAPLAARVTFVNVIVPVKA